MSTKIGLHIRLIDHINQVANKAHEMGMPYFQTFTIFPCGRYLQLDESDRQQFRILRKHFGPLFLHSSYWINCASNHPKADYLLEHEINLSEQLEFDFLVMHPGACHPSHDREQAIKLIAHRLSHFMKKYRSLRIVLENVAHGKRAIGGNIQELAAIRAYCDYPERVTFCLDTAHAHVYGYDISSPQAQDIFIVQLEQVLGTQNISLIHFNDTKKPLASQLDHHAIPGRGIIGIEALKRLINMPTLAHCAIILELPPLAQSDEEAILYDITEWKL